MVSSLGCSDVVKYCCRALASSRMLFVSASSGWSASSSSEVDEAIEGGTDSSARISEVVIDCFSLRASISAKGQWLALWPVDLQIEQCRESEQAEATWPSSSQLKQAKLLH